jgi:hypothetical protein
MWIRIGTVDGESDAESSGSVKCGGINIKVDR